MLNKRIHRVKDITCPPQDDVPLNNQFAFLESDIEMPEITGTDDPQSSRAASAMPLVNTTTPYAKPNPRKKQQLDKGQEGDAEDLIGFATSLMMMGFTTVAPDELRVEDSERTLEFN